MSEAECPKCNSTDRIPGAQLIDHGHADQPMRLGVSVQAYAPGLFFSGEVEHKVYGHVCGNCGYIELYVHKPQELLAKARKRIKQLKQEQEP